ncbi:MAG: tRNA (adenosine(37)-N6)-threonylcarbamoyltransferase complex ATPase subunit type 1 TsaE [Deltaproteobacteria bacterium]|nr:tRNA (adenosine(37)-N6)-threonylcarbamoyltransferase complex ATPase subunit type 1 TsaE [Deltaproteobacteria bacterium]TLN04555.1 MAG: tRNA (adenosine(37)-N6)-threonylcarbamoyltransferase complex ATPase subunit type 1 TsaE [bacterium]
MFSFVSTSVVETVALGRELGKRLLPGDFIALIGDLGAGKTHFVQGVAAGDDVPPEICVTSPSYTLLNEYSGRIPLYHFDLYRLHGDGDIQELGFEEYFYGDGVCLVEWAERLDQELPDKNLKIVFSQLDETTRKIDFYCHGSRYEKIVDELFSERGKSI